MAKVSGVLTIANLDAGDVLPESWVDNVKASIEALDAALGQNEPTNIDTDLVTISDTTGADLLNFSVLANTLGTANAIKFKAFLRLYNTSGNGDQDFTITLTYGTTDVCTVSGTIEGTATNIDSVAILEGTLIANGTNAQFGMMMLHSPGDAVLSGSSAGDLGGYGTGAEASTSALSFTLSAAFDASPGTARIYCHLAEAHLIDVS